MDNPMDPQEYINSVLSGAGGNLINELCEEAEGCDPNDLGIGN